MRLREMPGNYDGIYSLGHLCIASLQLRRLGLRPHAGVLDWMGSPNLSDVNRLLMNRFAGFMEREHLRVAGDAGEDMLLVAEGMYGIFSNHDFPKDVNTPSNLASYPEVKMKFDRRIRRLLDSMENGRRLLFVRTEGSFEDAWDLQTILSRLVRHDFRVLLVNHAPVTGIVELDWPLERVCAVQIPDRDIWEGNNDVWSTMFDGIRIN